jgi:hypothetical protein
MGIMKTALLGLIMISALMIANAADDMPIGFYNSMNNQKYRDVLFVKNYDAGASVTESYNDAEHLEERTNIETSSAGASCKSAGPCSGSGLLEASINSNVIGQAHIAWQSFDPRADAKGRHSILGRSIEDLTGVFSIQKFILLWANSTPGEISVDWMSCI